MRGTILDYTNSEAFILLDDDSIITIPTQALSKHLALGSKIDLTILNNGSYSVNSKALSSNYKNIDIF